MRLDTTFVLVMLNICVVMSVGNDEKLKLCVCVCLKINILCFHCPMLVTISEEGVPKRMFMMGFEPEGRRRINKYFNLRWIDIIRDALEDKHLQMLAESQFSSIMQMGNHTFSVMFVHYLLSRQPLIEKEYELW